jgi:hypothetical protein
MLMPDADDFTDLKVTLNEIQIARLIGAIIVIAGAGLGIELDMNSEEMESVLHVIADDIPVLLTTNATDEQTFRRLAFK